MRYITKTILSIFCALALMLTLAGAHAAGTLDDAIKACDAGEIRRLVGETNIHEKDQDGNTYLHYAALTCDSSEIIDIFVSAGININVKTVAGKVTKITPLHYAANEGHAESALMLIKAGANIRARDDNGSTPLFMAAGRGHTKTAILLIKAGADVNVKAIDKWTPLHFAAIEGHTETVKLLIKAGADTNAKDKDGKTPLEHAIIGLNPLTAYALMFP